ncbi:MAG TPA: aromatic ring-hydroxylating dioxygenase subunit alpha [Rhizomicrobium sp.]|nr:aromatic ring-hydroxylating dioxygenase subunit alpha [Rhizomicrobium sp.]
MVERFTTAPIEVYGDPDVYARERERIFARSWQFLGLKADLPRAGDYLADVLAGYPVVVVRDEKGKLRGYHNVCRHRAGPLVGDTKGHCDHEFVCQYHDWTYSFDGHLKNATGFDPADGLNLQALNLFPIKVETWRDFVFVNLDAGSSSLAELLRPLDEKLGHQQPHRSARVRDRHSIACNWKVYTENYLDGYHRQGVHPALASEEGARRINIHMEGNVALCEAPKRSGGGGGVWAWVWPNLGIRVYRGVLLIEHIRPEGPGRTLIDHVFLHEPEDPGVDAAISHSEQITEEDSWICERVQQNLDAGIYRQGVLSPSHEDAVAWFQGHAAQAAAKEQS